MIDGDVLIARLAGPSFAGPADVEALAELWPVTPDRLRWALAGVDVGLDDEAALELTVRITEALEDWAFRRWTEDRTDVAAVLAFAEIPKAPRGLTVDPELEDRLPLLELAADLARRSPAGRLRVELVDAGSMPGVDGICSRTSKGSSILLDRVLIDREAPDLEHVFAHELGHMLDPGLAGADTLSPEVFADELAPLLLAERPASVVAAAPLVDEVLARIAALRRPMPGARASVADIVEWALIELELLSAPIELIAAHVPAAPGVNSPTAEVAAAPASGEGSPNGGVLTPEIPAPGVTGFR